jgi:hypothetical protein
MSKVPTGRCAYAARGDELTGLIKKFLEIGIYATGNEFDAQRVRTLNAGLLMITAVGLVSLPVMLLSGRGQRIGRIDRVFGGSPSMSVM